MKLVDYNDEYRTLKTVRPLAEPYFQTAIQANGVTETLLLQQYAETVYFPHCAFSKIPKCLRGWGLYFVPLLSG